MPNATRNLHYVGHVNKVFLIVFFPLWLREISGMAGSPCAECKLCVHVCRPQDTSLHESLLGVFLIVRHG